MFKIAVSQNDTVVVLTNHGAESIYPPVSVKCDLVLGRWNTKAPQITSDPSWFFERYLSRTVADCLFVFASGPAAGMKRRRTGAPPISCVLSPDSPTPRTRHSVRQRAGRSKQGRVSVLVTVNPAWWRYLLGTFLFECYPLVCKVASYVICIMER